MRLGAVVVLQTQNLFNLGKLLDEGGGFCGPCLGVCHGRLRLCFSRGESRFSRQPRTLSSLGIFSRSTTLASWIEGRNHVNKEVGHIKAGIFDALQLIGKE